MGTRMGTSRHLGKDLETAWAEFVTRGCVQEGKVRPEILASWQRCAKALVDHRDGACHLILSPDELLQARACRKSLIDIAGPFMDKLYEFVAGSGLIVFLSDESGSILESVGDFDVADNASKVNLVTGTGWLEDAVGTNGIGTALALKRPIQVSGKEHYCEKLHTWTCSAAPIKNPDGDVIGALQMSGPSHAVHLHTLGMIVASVEAVESQLRIRRKTRELIRLNNSLNNIFQTMSDGAVITDRDGVISKVNPAGKKILGGTARGRGIRQLLGNRPGVWDALEQGQSFTDMELLADAGPASFHCLVTAKPIWDGNRTPTGSVIFLKPIHRVKRFINRFSSAQASFHFSDIIGNSPRLKRAIDAAQQAAPGISNILISGESGTGKELFAQAIHNASLRQKGPFIALNCAALPRELIASELFGYADGAFTGARKGGRPGKFEMADGGTLFLDEIGDMPLDQQAILLRVLQEKRITRIGGDHTIPVDVRVVCATHKQLKLEVEKGNFRADLYYRLNVILVTVPPLRERPRDVPPLFFHLLEKICGRQGIPLPEIPPGILSRLGGYPWPGNVRELENVVEKLVNAAGQGQLSADDLPVEFRGREAGGSARTAPQTPAALQSTAAVQPAAAVPAVPADRDLSSGTFFPSRAGEEEGGIAGLRAERQTLVRLLARHRGNVSQVARELKVSRNTVYRKLKFYRISRDQSFA